MQQVEAVVFDLDGTLCESTQDEETVFAGAFEAVDLPQFGAVDELWAALDGPPDPEDEQSYLAAGFRRLGAQYGHRQVPADELAAGLLDTVDRRAVAFRDGADGALRAARAHGPVGVLTNGPASRQRPKVESLALADRVDTVWYAGDRPRRKPHPEPFTDVCETLGTAPKATLYVGDSLAYDVAGAHGAGLQAAWCPRTPGDSEGYRPEYVFDSPADLIEVLERSDEPRQP
ncbi:HAD family hydrolase [Haloarcula sp. GH36]|uniref:HAD family hydrolase n=1 Tax=Haloarcula montana TaxID=3111776 RepID=UPI002D788E5C|nr:HAD family hydrolase [Haloarcula sp. GH36]